ncbi:Cof-type HAD-IIB family hydrolase [Lactobacillus sp. ESL0791]|uniref:Cof-type HAD-IIB family hydrolase n=1 Tax=Lactobacillus sp. ESL0791 TaxID=2983234 RepID=UPI0023F8B4B2|nr:Cof-type HAD-IIB family hydrolase [Lactobacillus sp. ESL0791]MDF7638683.1 Cof-type HAD-IIB family hydrolase [Lactobacillus sp. ESL0791]
MPKIHFKAVAVDMDGTFENDQLEYDHRRFEHVLTKLRQHHIHFIVSSGRPMMRLRRDFSGFLNRINVVADNGSILLQDNKIISSHVFTYKTAIKLINFIQNYYPSAQITASGIDRAYINPRATPDFKKKMFFYYPDLVQMANLTKIPPSDRITKLTLDCSSSLAGKMEREFNNSNSERIFCTTSGFSNIDVMPYGVNKAQGLKYFLRYFDIKPEELIAFGDGLNDKEMLELAGYSYAMANGDERIIKLAKYKAPSNNDSGVLQVLESYLQ